MTIKRHAISMALAGISLAALLLVVRAVQPLKIDFSDETVGAERKSFLSVVGVWRIEADGNNKVLVVDGFFFSSRRRHTRSLCDWSSDVCSSDLHTNPCGVARRDSTSAAVRAAIDADPVSA